MTERLGLGYYFLLEISSTLNFLNNFVPFGLQFLVMSMFNSSDMMTGRIL